jgi:hypothetical protein
MLSLLAFWISSGFIEGWKWRLGDGKVDNHPLINVHSYHTWRAVTNIGVLLLVPETLLLLHFLDSYLLVTWLSFVSYVIGWELYERIIGYVQYNNPFVKRPDFFFINKHYPRPPVAVEMAIVAILIIISSIIIIN